MVEIGKKLGSNIIAYSNGLTPNHGTVSTGMSNQVVRLQSIYIRNKTNIEGVKWYQSVAGVYTANNYNGVGLYFYSGGTLTLVAISTNDGNIWKATSNTWSSKNFSSTYEAVPGVYFIGLLYCTSSQGTPPSLGGFFNLVNANIASVDYSNSEKFSGTVSSQTGLSSTYLMSNVSPVSSQYILALY
jgi:hypothetical protein